MHPVLSFEKFFAVNFLMDLIAIGLAAGARERFRPRRVAAAALIAALYAAAAFTAPLAFLKNAASQALLALILAAVAIPAGRLWDIPLNALGISCVMVFLGGVNLLLGDIPGSLFIAAPVGSCCIIRFSRARRKKLVSWEVDVLMRRGGYETRFKALVDTGNRLREPFSGLPVMIAESALLAPVLPPGFDAGSELPPRGFRQVGFGALGGCGRLNCFRPDELYIDMGLGLKPAPSVWVAVYPGRIPGHVRALAPPSLGMASDI